MKYKILLTGSKKTIIDDLFTKSGSLFEYQSTSSRYEDIISHLNSFQPNAFLYCLNHEAPESFLRMPELKKHPAAANTAFFAVGTRGECDTYTRTAPDAINMTMETPITISAMEEKMKTYFLSLIKPTIVAPPLQMNTAAGNAAPSNNTVSVNGTAAGTVSNHNAAINPGTASNPNTVPAAGNAPSKPPANTAQAPVPPQTAGTVQPKQAAAAAPAQPPKQPKAADTPGIPDDPNDALLQALTEHVGEAAKIIEAVENLPLLDEDGIDDSDDGTSHRKHILVVDDDSRMLKIIKRHLADKYDVATALNGRLALKFLETKKTNLILLDYEMPLENGPSILKKLKENPYTHDIPVIFLTGISDRQRIEKALVLKPQGYLLKPIDHIKLLSTISKLIG